MPRRLLLALVALVPFASSAATAAPSAPQPQWVWLSEDRPDNDHTLYRRTFEASGIAAARLFVASTGSVVRVWVNGERVLRHTEPNKPGFVDVSKQLDLDSGRKHHVIAISVHNEADLRGLVVRLDLDSGWRDTSTIGTDGKWRAIEPGAPGGGPGNWRDHDYDDSGWKPAKVLAQLGEEPFPKSVNGQAFAAIAQLKTPRATAVEAMKVAKGFEVELLYSVPKAQQGSWVNLCTDPKGRLIVSDQYGSLYRVTPPGINGAEKIEIEKIPADIGEAQGLLWAFDSLYVSVNRGQKYPGGLYRVTDEDGDDVLETVKTLRPLNGSGEHGPHAVLPHPDGKSLVVVCGNRTDLTKIDTSRVPRTWDEDRLLPRPQGRFMRGTRAPGGYICRIDPEGKTWELMASGFRNQFDAAFNREGELFTYDADMEWDLNTPWYRPTRICHVTSGAEFGWRSGGGKWPVHFEDSVPAVIDIGPGSPTGVCFGYGAAFPTKYRNALFAADWSYGKLYAVHLEPRGATFTAKAEEFITGIPLPLTDVIVNPVDEAMYFLIGGRKVQSGLYRVTYSGSADAEAVTPPKEVEQIQRLHGMQQRRHRREIEEHHLGGNDKTVATVWPYLGDADRALRYAARIALEQRPREEWMEKALAEDDPRTSLTALMALARTFERMEKGKEPDIDTPVPDWSTVDPDADAERAAVRDRIYNALEAPAEAWDDLSTLDRHTMLRVGTLTFLRIAPPTATQRGDIAEWLRGRFPSGDPELDVHLAELMVYVQSPDAAKTLVPVLEEAPTQELQIAFAASLRHLRTGWTPELRERFFKWFTRAKGYRGGASFTLFVQNLQNDAVALLDEETKKSLEPILTAKPPEDPLAIFASKPRAFVKKWTMAELAPLMETGLKGRNFERGRTLFAAGACFACHRFDGRGGAVGPDLTALSGRFSPRDILESVLEPSKQVSDQYAAVQIITTDGKVIVGRIVNLAGDSVRVQTNMLDPGALQGVDRKQIEEIMPAKSSMMPTGLLDTMQEDEVLDLMAYLLSRGDRSNAMFE